MYTLLLLALFFTSSFAASVTVGAVSNTDDSLTAIGYTATATTSGFVVVGAYANVQRDPTSNNGTVDSAKLDVRKIALGTPGPGVNTNGNDLGFYYGALDASGSVTWNNNAVQASVDAALAELGVAFQSIFIYYNRDGTTGFQWKNLSDPIFNCSTGTYDCVDATGYIRFKEDLDWGNVVYQTPQACPAASSSSAAYTSDCKVYTAEVSGYVPGTSRGTHVVTFSFHVANQPVLVNGNELPTGTAKIDVNITYPWTSKTLTGATGFNPKVGLSVLAAGKFVVGSYVGTAVTVNGDQGYKWGSSSYATTWAVKDSADIDGNNGQVYYGSFTGDEVVAFTCGNLVLECVLAGTSRCFVCSLQAMANYYDAFGWNTRILWYTWDQDKPSVVYWDPQLSLENDATAPPSPTSSPSFGSTNVVSAGLLIVVFLFNLLI